MLYAWLSVKNQNSESGTWFWLIVVSGLFPGWAVVSKFTKSMTADAVIYDLCMSGGFLVALLFFSKDASRFNYLQFIGYFTAVAGFILMKFGGE